MEESSENESRQLEKMDDETTEVGRENPPVVPPRSPPDAPPVPKKRQKLTENKIEEAADAIGTAYTCFIQVMTHTY